MFLMSAYAIKENRLMDIVVGLFIVAVGIALLVVKSVNSDQLVDHIRMHAIKPPFAARGRL